MHVGTVFVPCSRYLVVLMLLIGFCAGGCDRAKPDKLVKSDPGSSSQSASGPGVEELAQGSGQPN